MIGLQASYSFDWFSMLKPAASAVTPHPVSVSRKHPQGAENRRVILHRHRHHHALGLGR